MGTVVLPNLRDLRNLEQFPRDEAIILRDNDFSHVCDVILALLPDARVRVITSPSPTTQLFEQPDILLFWVVRQSS
jgi:hypothetical protein